jgi:hypothetical protein
MEREGDQWFYDLRKWREGLRLRSEAERIKQQTAADKNQ